MTQSSLRNPPNLQSRPKTVPSFNKSSLAPNSTTTAPQISRPSSQSRQGSPARYAGTSDTSDKTTAALTRRVLCPYTHASTTDPRPLDELLPPLTSSNEVDFQLYAIIAIVVRDLVQSWYAKITPDHGFVEEVIKIIAHCTRGLESRLKTVDLEGLVFDEIPELAERHISAYRVSHQRIHPAPLSIDPRITYHNLCPHPAFSPVPNLSSPSSIDEQLQHEAEYRQLLVQGALAVLLPTEDLENACLRILVADVTAESIIGNSIGGTACEGWFLWASISKLIEVVKSRTKPKITGEGIEIDARSRLEKFGLLSEKEEKTGSSKRSQRSTLSFLTWRILQFAYLAFIGVRFVILGFIAASSQPLRSSTTPRTASSVEASPIEKNFDPARQPRPILSFRIIRLLSSLVNLRLRMPWLAASLGLLHHHMTRGPLAVGATDGILDRYIHHLLQTPLSPIHLPALLSILRSTLFPNNALPPPAPPPPSAADISAVKRTCALSILSLIPPTVAKRVFGTGDEDEWVRDVEGELEVWGDGYLNRHLMYAILELVVVRVLPEMGKGGVRGLEEGRLGGDLL